MDLGAFIAVGFLVVTWLLFAIWAAPKVLRFLDSLEDALKRINNWWISL